MEKERHRECEIESGNKKETLPGCKGSELCGWFLRHVGVPAPAVSNQVSNKTPQQIQRHKRIGCADVTVMFYCAGQRRSEEVNVPPCSAAY